MKIAFLSTIYPKHCQLIYKEHDLYHKSYHQQFLTIKKEAISAIGNWPDYLRKKGYDCQMFCRNNDYLQEQWCKENQFSPNHKHKQFSILLEQLKRFQPDILFIFGASYYNEHDRLRVILEKVPSVKKTAVWYAAPEGNENAFRSYDIVFTCSSSLQDNLHQIGIESKLINHAFETEVLNHINQDSQINQLFFSGSINKWSNFHKERTELIEYLAEHSKISIYGEIPKISIKDKLHYKLLNKRSQLSIILKKAGLTNKKLINWSHVENLPKNPNPFSLVLIKSLHPGVYGLEMFKALAKFNITVNGHIDIAKNDSCNQRLFEATGVGSCLLTDTSNRMSQLFEEDYEIVTYKCKEEALEKATYLLDHPEEAKKIAKKGQQKTLSHHTTEKQVEKLISYIEELEL